jgi:hypothetical protein
MSATLPRIDKIDYSEKNCDFFELLPSASEYQLHPCFSQRASIRLKPEIETVEELVGFVQTTLDEAPRNPFKLLVVVNTIRRAREVFDQLPESYKIGGESRTFKKYLLHSELLPHIREGVVDIARNSHENMILVSTQCIEAGIDADFDIGIRDIAIPDSVEQVSGRINRHGKKTPLSNLFVISLKRSEKLDAEQIYVRNNGKNRRWEVTEDMGAELRGRMFRERDYSEYYTRLRELIRSRNRAGLGVSIPGRNETEAARNLRLKVLKEFHVIEDMRTTGYFVPIRIPVAYFSKSELRQLPTDAIDSETVNGYAVWNQYGKIKALRGREGFLRLAAFSPIVTKFVAKMKYRGTRAPEEGIAPPPETSLNDATERFIWEDGTEYDVRTGFVESDNIF